MRLWPDLLTDVPRAAASIAGYPKRIPRCRTRLTTSSPVNHGGKTAATNTCIACFACNNHKGPNIAGIDNVTGKLVRLFNPRRHKWAAHFRWEGPMLVGKTPIGRATVAVLAINLAHRVALRKALMDERLFPTD